MNMAAASTSIPNVEVQSRESGEFGRGFAVESGRLPGCRGDLTALVRPGSVILQTRLWIDFQLILSMPHGALDIAGGTRQRQTGHTAIPL